VTRGTFHSDHVAAEGTAVQPYQQSGHEAAPPAPPAQSTEHSADPAAQVAARLDVLVDLGDRPLAEHAEVYQQLHADLQKALADIELTEPPPAARD
jgi:hypothetical protein